MWADDRRRTFQTYADMKNRCQNPKAQQYKNYGARGIGICPRWLDSFENFVADMGLRPDGLTLERIDNNAHYYKANCRWATRAEQRRNQRGCIHIIHCGQTRTLEEWSRELGIPAQTIRRRYRKGVHGDALFSVPNAVKSSAGKNGNASRWSAIAAQDAGSAAIAKGET